MQVIHNIFHNNLQWKLHWFNYKLKIQPQNLNLYLLLEGNRPFLRGLTTISSYLFQNWQTKALCKANLIIWIFQEISSQFNPPLFRYSLPKLLIPIRCGSKPPCTKQPPFLLYTSSKWVESWLFKNFTSRHIYPLRFSFIQSSICSQLLRKVGNPSRHNNRPPHTKRPPILHTYFKLVESCLFGKIALRRI